MHYFQSLSWSYSHFCLTQFYLDIINIQNWCFWLYGSQQIVEKRWEYQTTWPASWETCMQVEKQQLELDMEQQTGSKSGKENVKAVYCHPAYLTYIQSTSWGMLGWMKHKLNQDCREKY